MKLLIIGDAEFPGTVLRLPKVYGPGDYQAQFYGYFKRMSDNRPYILLSEEEAGFRWTHDYIENIALAIVKVAENDHTIGQIYNAGEARTPTMKERISYWARVMNWDGDLVILSRQSLPEKLQNPFNYAYHLEVNTLKLRDMIELSDEYAIEESIAKTAEWYESGGHVTQDFSDYYKAEDTYVSTL